MANNYNPDVLNCIANLSNDEVFTPPALANQVLDLLPQDLFQSPDTTFLDPFTKSGVFLREIVKRLDRGLTSQIPDRQQRIDHILHKQVFGIACTELTSLLARRSVYCSKHADGKYCVSPFSTTEGNILFSPIQHTWENEKCVFCGATKNIYDRGAESEQYAYQFIHTNRPESFFNMTFDVIIGNPPYQLKVGVEMENYAIPIYNKFVEQAKKLNPRYLTMIIPSRWFAGGRGLDDFRAEMLNDKHLTKIVDFPDSKDCFQGVDIAGGVCYFLRERDRESLCEFTSINHGKINTAIRRLNEFEIFARNNETISIIHKVTGKKEATMQSVVSVQTPFGFITTFKGATEPFPNALTLKTSTGNYYVSRDEVSRNKDIVDNYKVIFGAATSEHAGVPDRNGQYRVFSSLGLLPPQTICSQSYFVADSFKDEVSAQNCYAYLKTKFVRFLLLQALTSQHISRDKFVFVPLLPFDKLWTDEELYKKYGFSEEEITFIETTIRSME